MAIVVTDDKHYKDIAKTIREKTGTENQYTSSRMAEGVNDVYEAGYNQGYEAGYNQGANSGGENLMPYVRGYATLFSEAQFPENTQLELALNSGHFSDCSGIFAKATGLKGIKLTGGEEKVCTCTNLFSTLKDTETIDISELKIKFGGCINFFLSNAKLKRIIGEIDLSSCTATTNFFLGCSALEDVRFKAGTISLSISLSYSPNLTAETTQSIIDGLADLTGQTAQTISWHSTVLGKLTPEQCTQIESKNWLYN